MRTNSGDAEEGIIRSGRRCADERNESVWTSNAGSFASGQRARCVRYRTLPLERSHYIPSDTAVLAPHVHSTSQLMPHMPTPQGNHLLAALSDAARNRLAALRDGERSDGGNLRGGKRWSCRRRLVLGGRNHPEQGGRAERRQRLPIAADSAQRRVQSPRRVADADVALHALPHHADGPDGGLQPAPHFGPAALPLAVAFPGPPAEQYLDDDPGTDW